MTHYRERCCTTCRTHLAVCRDRDCWCHLEQQAIARQQDTSHTSRPPRPDPVGERAARSADKDRERRKRGGRP